MSLSGLLIFGLLIAAVIWVFFRGPGRRLLLGGMPGARSRREHRAGLSDRAYRIGGPFSDADFGGFRGARRPRD